MFGGGAVVTIVRIARDRAAALGASGNRRLMSQVSLYGYVMWQVSIITLVYAMNFGECT